MAIMDTLVVFHKVKEVYPEVVKGGNLGTRLVDLKEAAGALAAKDLMVVAVVTQAAGLK